MFRPFWYLVHKIYGKKNHHMIHIPAGFLGRFDFHYFIYDNNDNVVDGAKNLMEAIQKTKKNELYLTRIWECN